MDIADAGKRADALAFLKKHRTGALATVSQEGSPRVRLVYYASGDAFEIYFMTKKSTRKVDDITRDSRVAFTISSEDVPQALQIEGVASLVEIPAEPDTVLNNLFQTLALNKHFVAPLTKLGDSELLIMKIQPTWIRWGDFAFAEEGLKGVFVEVDV